MHTHLILNQVRIDLWPAYAKFTEIIFMWTTTYLRTYMSACMSIMEGINT